jgi:hypothetical protein
MLATLLEAEAVWRLRAVDKHVSSVIGKTRQIAPQSRLLILRRRKNFGM